MYGHIINQTAYSTVSPSSLTLLIVHVFMSSHQEDDELTLRVSNITEEATDDDLRDVRARKAEHIHSSC